jgi:protein required for attachment to host cells
MTMREHGNNPVHIPRNALVLVGDGRKALFLRNKGTPNAVELIVERELRQDNPPTREQGTDRPGRKHGADGVSRSAIEETDWHDRAEEHFAAQIAETLYEMEHAQKFNELVVVAAPRFLGNLRDAFHPEVTQCVVAEVPKDLTSHPVPELAKVLS